MLIKVFLKSVYDKNDVKCMSVLWSLFKPRLLNASCNCIHDEELTSYFLLCFFRFKIVQKFLLSSMRYTGGSP